MNRSPRLDLSEPRPEGRENDARGASTSRLAPDSSGFGWVASGLQGWQKSRSEALFRGTAGPRIRRPEESR